MNKIFQRVVVTHVFYRIASWPCKIQGLRLHAL